MFKGSVFMKKIISMVLLTVIVFSVFSVTVSAANACSYIFGNSNNSKTFYATTDNWWLTNGKIKITQSKGTATKDSYKGGGTYSTYSYFTIRVSDGKGYSKTYSMTGKSRTVTLPKRNTRYSITVTPGSNATMRISMGSINRWFSSWKSPAYWEVSKTKHIDMCN